MADSSFVFYPSWRDALKEMPPEIQLEAYDAICTYGCGGEVDMDALNPWTRSVLKTVMPQIDANKKRRENGKLGAEYGAKGGRPRKTPAPKEDEIPDEIIETALSSDGNPIPDNIDNPGGVFGETPYANVNANVDVDVNVHSNAKTTKRRFVPPTVEQVAAYCAERGNGINPQDFVDYYEQSNWKLKSGQKMVSWEAAIRNWENRRKESPKAEPGRKNPFTDYTHRTSYDYDALERKITENARLIAND